jgi:hypothetical protein
VTTPSIERNHDGAYVTRVRPSDLEALDTEAERRRDQDARGRAVAGNKLATGSGAKHALTHPLKAVRDAVQAAAGSAIAPDDAREVVKAALKLYAAHRRAVGHAALPVLARVLRAAVNDALSSYFTVRAAELGFGTELGLAMLDAAHRCENRAERSMTAALAFAKAIGSRPPTKPEESPWFEAEGEESGK